MSPKLSVLALLAGSFFLLAFPNNPPDGHTGAPNEGTCANCHTLGTGMQNGSISITGLPAVITPNSSYVLTMTSSNPNGIAELAGFQLTVLDQNNQKAGNITGASAGSHTESSNQRQYWEHFPSPTMYPMSNVVMWTATWTATNIPANANVTAYAAGNIANGNGFSSGDLIVTTTATGMQMGGGVELTVTITNANDVLCNGQNTGSATALATGGVAPYTYSWSTGASGPSINNVPAGTYVVTVTDNADETATASVTISEPEELDLNLNNINHVECFGGNDGSLSVSTSGGVGPYFYTWSNGMTGPTISNLSAGPYTVTVTDDNTCTLTSTYTITQPAMLNIAINNLEHESCAGENDGSISITVTGGVGPYFAEWSNSFIGLMNFDLEPGDYSVTVTDNNNCTKEASYTINPGGVVDVSVLQIQHVTCNGGSNGAISVAATGGVSPYTYAWSNGMSGASITGLTAGTYLVTVTDAQDCSVVEGYTVTQPTAIVVSIAQTGVNTCFGDSIVDLTATANGGVPAYTAVWSDGTSGLFNDNVGAGLHTITVTDMSGCTKTSSVTVTQPPQLIATVSTTDETSGGANDGTASVSVTGGSGPYSYIWNNGNTNDTITGLVPGLYTVTVTDVSGCTTTASGQVNAFGCTINLLLGNDFVMCEEDTSLLTSIVVGATGVVTYVWSDGSTGSTLQVSTGGEYCLTATDESNCIDTDCIIVSETIIGPFTCPVTNESAPGANDGAIDCSGLVGFVSYAWSNGFTTPAITLLSPGEYCLTVTDADGCIGTDCFIIQPGGCQMTLTSLQANASCPDVGDGSITLTVTGGTAPLTFAWSNGDTNSIAENLLPGDYAVTVSDAAGCVEEINFQITSPSAIVITVDTIINITGSPGAILISVEGGSPPYTFLWTDPFGGTADTEDRLNVSSVGYYTVVVTDIQGCTATLDSILVDEELAVDPVSKFKPVKVYPVPANDVLFVDFEKPIVDAFITGIDGRMCRHISNPANNKLDVAGLEAGWYLIRITDGKSWYIARMIK